MFRAPRRSDHDQPHSLLMVVIVSLVALSFLFGFGAATLIFRLQGHGRPDAILPGLILSFFGVVIQFGILRLLLRHRAQPSE